jgi:hypothetical protein
MSKYKLFQKELYNFYSLYTENMHSFFELSYCRKTYRVLLGIVISTGNAWCLKQELYNVIPNVTVWRALGKSLHLRCKNYPSFNTLNDGLFLRL